MSPISYSRVIELSPPAAVGKTVFRIIWCESEGPRVVLPTCNACDKTSVRSECFDAGHDVRRRFSLFVIRCSPTAGWYGMGWDGMGCGIVRISRYINRDTG